MGFLHEGKAADVWRWPLTSIQCPLYAWMELYSILGVRLPGACHWQSTQSIAEVKEKVQLYLYFLSEPSGYATEWTFTFTAPIWPHIMNRKNCTHFTLNNICSYLKELLNTAAISTVIMHAPKHPFTHSMFMQNTQTLRSYTARTQGVVFSCLSDKRRPNAPSDALPTFGGMPRVEEA